MLYINYISKLEKNQDKKGRKEGREKRQSERERRCPERNRDEKQRKIFLGLG